MELIVSFNTTSCKYIKNPCFNYFNALSIVKVLSKNRNILQMQTVMNYITFYLLISYSF